MTIHTYATASEALPVLMDYVMEYGDEVGSRNGRAMEVLNPQIVLTNPVEREIITPLRKANIYAQIAETIWVLSGRDDIEWLSTYLPRAKDYSDDGERWRGAYGPRLRSWPRPPWPTNRLDQLAHVVELLKADPLSRRAVISIYDPARDTEPGKDIPCNDFLQFQSREGYLHLTVTVRSNDLMWGWSGINAFEWSTLQEVVASILNVMVGTLTFNIGNLHLYSQHWQRATEISHQSVENSTAPSSKVGLIRSVLELDEILDRWFQWEAKCRQGHTLSVLDLEKVGSPLFMEWGAAIAYYWTRDEKWRDYVSETRLGMAMAQAPTSVLPEPLRRPTSTQQGQGHPQAMHERTGAFYTFVKDLHAKKHESYGDSWKKRGEKMSILANMARKADRLGVGDEYDSSADTWIDFLVYALKYETWLKGEEGDPEDVEPRLAHYLRLTEEITEHANVWDIVSEFNTYCDTLDKLFQNQKIEFVANLAVRVAPIARDVWFQEQQQNEQDEDQYRGADAD